MPAELSLAGPTPGAVYEVVFCDPPPPGGDDTRGRLRRARQPSPPRLPGQVRDGALPMRALPGGQHRLRPPARPRRPPPDPGAPAYVPAGPVREHLEWLRAGGVGLRRVAEVSGVFRSALTDIAAGRQRRLRPPRGADHGGERRDAAAGALVDGAGTWELRERLLAAGCSRAWIARQLGSQAAARAAAVAGAGAGARHGDAESDP